MVFLPPRGVKIRSIMESVVFPAEPSLLAGWDDDRIVMLLYVGIISDQWPIIARTKSSINASQGLVAYDKVLEIYGPEEIWVAQVNNVSALVTQNWTYQVLYYK